MVTMFDMMFKNNKQFDFDKYDVIGDITVNFELLTIAWNESNIVLVNSDLEIIELVDSSASDRDQAVKLASAKWKNTKHLLNLVEL